MNGHAICYKMLNNNKTVHLKQMLKDNSDSVHMKILHNQLSGKKTLW